MHFIISFIANDQACLSGDLSPSIIPICIIGIDHAPEGYCLPTCLRRWALDNFISIRRVVMIKNFVNGMFMLIAGFSMLGQMSFEIKDFIRTSMRHGTVGAK